MPKSRKEKHRAHRKKRPSGTKVRPRSSQIAQKDEQTKFPRENPGDVNRYPTSSSNSREQITEQRTLFSVITYVPLVIGAWLAGGVQLPYPMLFTTLLFLGISAHYFELLLIGVWVSAQARLMKMLFLVLQVISLAAFYIFTADLLALGWAVIFSILSVTSSCLAAQAKVALSARVMAIRALALLAQMSILGVLGVYSQTGNFFPSTALLGFVPGCYLMSAELARYAAVFEKEGWHRQRFKMQPGSDDKRLLPGSLTGVFSLLLVLGPASALSLAMFDRIPGTFLLTAVPVYFMPQVATSFLEKLRDDRSISRMCERMAALAALTVWLSGLAAQFR